MPDASTTDPAHATRAIIHDHPDTDEPRRLFNRELSWLGFNERVLALAARDDLPLLEKAKFLAIFQDNLDEFFQVRVAGLMDQVAAGLTRTSPDGMRPADQLTTIRTYASDLVQAQVTLFHQVVAPGLAAEGVRYSDWNTLDDADRKWLTREFEERVFPVLTPLAVDPAHPFPYISNLSLNLAVVLRDPDEDETRFARVKVPPILPRFVLMPDGERYVPLEQVIAAHLDRLFPGIAVADTHVFRVTRNADLVVEEDEADDLLLAIESELKQRRRGGQVVRLEIEPGMPTEVFDLLSRELGVTDEQVDRVPGPLDLAGLWALYDIDRPELKYEPYAALTQPRLADAPGEHGDIFAEIRRGDILVQHPYDSFTTSVQRFIDQAARDADVLAIKITLYRTSGPGSPIIRSLIKAAEEGKQVVALVELKARFDEEANIEWARVLEEAGAHVAYGVVGLKTHTKIAQVVRKEDGRIRRYCHIGTGNYNDVTATIYEDVGLLTCDPELGADITDLFNVLTGYGRRREYRKVITSPTTTRKRLLELIEREAAADDGLIVLKMNSLVDQQLIEALYAASTAGTKVRLIVRGICCLRPGVEGLSDNIRVTSIVGRYLEHSRIYRFGSHARGREYLIGSADLMPRNLDRRIEAITPVTDRELQERLEAVLDILREDDVLAWELHPDGSWTRVTTRLGNDTHRRLQEHVHDRER
jgi:polyphosphate kinase